MGLSVAAGLALSSNAGRGELTRAWIMFNRPKEPTSAHAGVLFALGLTGHLNVLTNTDLYRYLVQEHDATTVAALLGVAALPGLEQRRKPQRPIWRPQRMALDLGPPGRPRRAWRRMANRQHGAPRP